MPVVQIMGSELNSNTYEGYSAAGSVTTNSVYTRNSLYSLRLATLSGAGLAYSMFRGYSATLSEGSLSSMTTGCNSFDFMCSQLPLSGYEYFYRTQSNYALCINSDHNIVIAAGSTVLVPTVTGTTYIESDRWYNIKVYHTLNTVKIYIDNILESQYTRTNLYYAGYNYIYFGKSTNTYSNNITYYFDNLNIVRETGNIIGRHDIQALLVTGNGTYATGWTASTAEKYQCIDERLPSATDYVYSSTVNDTVTFKFGSPLSFDNLFKSRNKINTVKFMAYTQKSALSVTGNISLIISSNNIVITTGSHNLSFYPYENEIGWIQETNPFRNNSQWKFSDFDDLEFGIKLNSLSAGQARLVHASIIVDCCQPAYNKSLVGVGF